MEPADKRFDKLEALIQSQSTRLEGVIQSESSRLEGLIQSQGTTLEARIQSDGDKTRKELRDEMAIADNKLGVRVDALHHQIKLVAEGHTALRDHIVEIKDGI